LPGENLNVTVGDDPNWKNEYLKERTHINEILQNEVMEEFGIKGRRYFRIGEQPDSSNSYGFDPK